MNRQVGSRSNQSLESIQSEGTRLLAFARRDPEAGVPQYPGWQLRDMARHVASVHARTVAVCRELPRERIPAPGLPDGLDELDWLEETLAELVEELRLADPAEPAWCVTVEQTLGAWQQRMAIETGVHRWDAQGAFERPDVLPDVVALAGLDEFASLWLPRLRELPGSLELPTLEVHARDIGRTWTFGPGPPTARVSGMASELYLGLVARSGVRLPAEWQAAVGRLPTPVA